jgi:hypothetical protein
LLNKLINLSKSWGIEKVEFVDASKNFGTVYFKLKLIEIHLCKTETEMVATMCHELGHWVMYKTRLRKLLKLKHNRYLDELTADIVGNWIRIFYLGRKNLTDQDWQKFCNSIKRR